MRKSFRFTLFALLAALALGIAACGGDDDLVAITRTAVEASFADPALRDRLMTRLGNSHPASR